MRITKLDVRDFCWMFCMQLMQYCIYSVSTRAMAQARYSWVFGTDIAYGALALLLLKKVLKSESKWGTAGYILGGAFGSLLAIWITKRLWGV